MALFKLNAFILLILMTRELAESVTSYLSNTVNANEEPHQKVYSVIPQAYYVPQPYPRYTQVSSQKYVTPSDNQIPVLIGPTEKTILSPTYKAAIDASKYVAPQVAKPTQISYSNQPSYPYVYALAKAVPSTTTAYVPISIKGTNYYEAVPKKYHYGYRVSDSHTGNEFGHSEVNDGHSAKGYYHVLLPDGRLQNVKYWAGPSGYHATITYESKY